MPRILRPIANALVVVGVLGLLLVGIASSGSSPTAPGTPAPPAAAPAAPEVADPPAPPAPASPGSETNLAAPAQSLAREAEMPHTGGGGTASIIGALALALGLALSLPGRDRPLTSPFTA